MTIFTYYKLQNLTIMKLELKHLAPYLPYELKTKFWISKVIGSLGNREDELRDKLLTSQNVHFVLTYCKPILRPLSDLTKEIEINGEKFIPIVKIFNTGMHYLGIREQKFAYKLFEGYSQSPVIHEIPKDYKTMPYWIFNKLTEWHFNIFNLPEDLFIDINTI